MALPLLTVPFVAALFFLFGGGKGVIVASGQKTLGLNTALPDAHFSKKREPDKLSLYETVSQDSAKWNSAVRDDPYRKDSINVLSMSFGHSSALQDILKKAADKFPAEGYEKLNTSLAGNQRDDHEKDLKDKLSQLQAIVNAKPLPAMDPNKLNPLGVNSITVPPGPKYQKPNESNYSPDPDLVQLDKMLDKIEAIQHPEHNRDTMTSKKETVQTMNFQTASGENAVQAIIPEKQTLVSGTTIRLQLMDSVRINGSRLDAGQFVYGTAMLSNERLKIQVRTVRVGNNILTVNLSVYDLDGMEGIFVPGSMSREVSKQSLDQGFSTMGLTSLDPSIGAQAASAGIQAAKTLISRKVKMVEVTIPVGYQVLLKCEQHP